jgi:NAD+ synthase
MEAENIAKHIVEWLKSYADNAGMNGFVVGVSGGIDSAVTSKLCSLTGLPTMCVALPIHQDPAQVTRAQKHIAWLKKNCTHVSEHKVDLTTVFETFKASVPQHHSDDLVQLSLANARARLRMTTLYYLAGVHQALVAGTGNKVEDFGVGFYTKYGDGGVDLSPIADLLKSEVYLLGHHLGINEDILTAAPTDGLFGDSRTDQDQLGASYDELEWAMKLLEQHEDPDTSAMDERQKTTLEIFKKLNRNNQHKMRPIPVCCIPKNMR